MFFYRRLFAVLLFIVGLLSGCAPTTVPVVWQDPTIEWVYPPLPQQARIQFLRQIASIEDIRGADTASRRMFKWLSGEDQTSLPMVSPYAVTADGTGKIWITDPAIDLLYQIDLAQQKIDYFSIVSGRRLQTPTGVLFDNTNQRLYLSNAGSREVLVFDAENNYLLSLSPPDGFGRPGGMALDQSGNLYVADVLKGMIEVFSFGGRHIKSLGSALNKDGRFNHPSNLAIDSQGRVYVVDSFNFRVEVLGGAAESPQSIGRLGDSVGHFARPRGIALDSAGHVYVSDAAFDNIQIFDRTGKLLLVFGQPGDESADGFCMPAGLTFDTEDRLYVVDNCGHRVKIFKYLAE